MGDIILEILTKKNEWIWIHKHRGRADQIEGLDNMMCDEMCHNLKIDFLLFIYFDFFCYFYFYFYFP
jgi:hypothetical protein